MEKANRWPIWGIGSVLLLALIASACAPAAVPAPTPTKPPAVPATPTAKPAAAATTPAAKPPSSTGS